MIGLYKFNNERMLTDEYLLIEERITPTSINNITDVATNRFIKVNILPKLTKEAWFMGKTITPNKNIGCKVLTNVNTLTTEFTKIEETSEEYEEVCNKIKDFLYKPGITIYI